jgi:hypothetical protein
MVHDPHVECLHLCQAASAEEVLEHHVLVDQFDLVLVFRKSSGHLETFVHRRDFGDQEVVKDQSVNVDHYGINDVDSCHDQREC